MRHSHERVPGKTALRKIGVAGRKQQLDAHQVWLVEPQIKKSGCYFPGAELELIQILRRGVISWKIFCLLLPRVMTWYSPPGKSTRGFRAIVRLLC